MIPTISNGVLQKPPRRWKQHWPSGHHHPRGEASRVLRDGAHQGRSPGWSQGIESCQRLEVTSIIQHLLYRGRGLTNDGLLFFPLPFLTIEVRQTPDLIFRTQPDTNSTLVWRTSLSSARPGLARFLFPEVD